VRHHGRVERRLLNGSGKQNVGGFLPSQKERRRTRKSERGAGGENPTSP
jgi:hypothetical protein